MNLNIFKWSTPALILLLLSIPFLVIGGFAVANYLQIENHIIVNAPVGFTVDNEVMDWGTINIGESVERTFNFTNTGDSPSGTLIITTDAPAGLTLTPTTLMSFLAHESRLITFTVTANATIAAGEYDFYINVGEN